jgi:hypothetical protein
MHINSNQKLYAVSRATIMLAAMVVALGTSVPLTKDSFDEQTKGKSVFVKFYAPW